MTSETEEVFEINDFTVVTETEHLIVFIESQLHEWGLNGKRRSGVQSNVNDLKEKSAVVTFKEKEFELIFFHVDQEEDGEDASKNEEKASGEEDTKTNFLPTSTKDMIDSSFDFEAENSVFTQYGILEHLLIAPANETNQISTENLLKEIKGAAIVASVNLDCEIPIFIQFGDLDRYLLNGFSQNKAVRTNFEGIHLENYLTKHRYFNGLVDMFKDKIACPLASFLNIETSIRFDYLYKIDAPISSDDIEDDEKNPNFLLFFGADENLVNELELSILWPRLPDGTVAENSTFTDLDPYYAPRWFLTAKYGANNKMLYNSLDELLDLRETNAGEIKVIDFVDYSKNEPNSTHQALSALTQNFSQNDVTIVNAQSAKSAQAKQFAQKKLEKVMTEWHPLEDDWTESQKELLTSLSQCKSAPLNSLTSKISIELVKCLLTNRRSLEKFCALWFEFVGKLRKSWENAKPLEGLEKESNPDLALSLLHQKLQMIQFCIMTKRKRHALLDEGKGVQALLNFSASSSSDIFYDAEEEEARPAEGKAESSRTPQGRSHVLENLHLLSNPSEPIFVPITQDRGPMTEDMIEHRTEYLAELDESQRVKAQLDTLVSDMQAFKAANPGAGIEDFVRWHSPRDWIEEEDNSPGHLSERMSQENIWLDTWNNAQPIPVLAQVRLFNEAKEAETILHQLEHLTIKELIDLVLPLVFHHAAYVTINNCDEIGKPLVEEKLKEFLKKLSSCTVHGTAEDYFDVHKLIPAIEVPLTKLKAVKELFEKEMLAYKGRRTELDKEMFKTLLLDLAQNRQPRVLDTPEGAIAMAIRCMMNRTAEIEDPREESSDSFLKKKFRLPKPFRKQYIFKTVCSRPGTESRLVPQRMYACVGPKHLRVCGSFTDDITFH